MKGDHTTGGSISDRDEYRDVAVKLYAEDGTLLYTERLGALQADTGRKEISVTIDTVPKYVVFVSPDLWTGEMQIEDYVYQNKELRYAGLEADSADELPVDGLILLTEGSTSGSTLEMLAQ